MSNDRLTVIVRQLISGPIAAYREDGVRVADAVAGSLTREPVILDFTSVGFMNAPFQMRYSSVWPS
jgi:hypothetical protein